MGIKLALFGAAGLCAMSGQQAHEHLSIKSVTALPSEALPPSNCTANDGGSGFLTTEKGRTKLSEYEIGQFVLSALIKGHLLQIYPQISGRIFVIESCPPRKTKTSAVP